MLHFFRTISLIEGLSLISLFFIAIPLRYQFGFDFVVPFTGSFHGVLFTTYFLLSLTVSHLQKWSVGFWLAVLFASVIPFACFFLDRKLKEQEMAAAHI